MDESSCRKAAKRSVGPGMGKGTPPILKTSGFVKFKYKNFVRMVSFEENFKGSYKILFSLPTSPPGTNTLVKTVKSAIRTTICNK